MRRTVYLIDGHAQIYRAYYAPFANLTAPSGEPTRATHVFCRMLLNLVREQRPDYLAVALDTSDETVFRRDIYPEYKAHREPPPEDLPLQSERIMQILTALRVPTLRVPRFEADDILATLVARYARQDLHVRLVSRDKDLEQLLSDAVAMYDPAKDEVITPERLFELKGWRPEQAIDAQILTGDPVDNVPGVMGIGPKTAAKLLEKYHTAQDVVAHADELTPKQRENVLAFAPQMEMVRQLLTLRTDVPLQFELEQAACAGFDWAAARPILAELGLRRLLEQWGIESHEGAEPRSHEGAEPRSREGAEPRSREGPAPPSPATDSSGRPPSRPQITSESLCGATILASSSTEPRSPEGEDGRPAAALDSVDADAAAGHALAAAAQGEHVESAKQTERAVAAPAAAEGVDELGARLRQPDGGDYRLINTPQQFEALVTQLARQDEFAIDTETTSVNAIDAELVGISLAWEVGRGYYVPVRSVYGSPLAVERIRKTLGPLLRDEKRRKVGHNLKYDLIVLREAGLPVAGPLFDTMIAAFVVDPTRTSYSLDRLAEAWLGHRMIPITDLIGKGRDQLRMDQVPLEHVGEYAAEDADYTWRLRQLLEPQLAGAGVASLFFETEMPLVSVLTDMEHHGISLDVEFLRQIGREMATRAAAIVDEVHALAGTPFNLDSPKQLGEVLFDKMGFRVVRTTRTARSTDAETLETLARETGHPLLQLLLEYREIQKLRGTYVDALPAASSRRTGRIHTSFHQTGVVTGRLSSSEPNLQNIPVRSELGRQIRRAFVPRSRDELLIVADYSQVELRVLAHFCQDETLIEAFAADRDIHAFVAAQVNGVPLEQVTKEMRARAKAVNFGIIYGQTAHGLAQTTGLSRTDAQQFIDAYFRRYPRIRTFIEQCIVDTKRDGGVRTIQGRYRPIPDIDSRNRMVRAQAERFAVNTVIQGSAADLIKTAMIQLHRRIQAGRLPLRLLLQVHDELVCEAPRAQVQRMAGIIRDVMTHAMTLRVPLKVDVACGENWLEAK